jgi:hypothetical protein
LGTHVLRHQTQTIRFDFARLLRRPGTEMPRGEMRAAIQERRKNQAVAMQIRRYQQACAVHSVQGHDLRPGAHAVHMGLRGVMPGIAIERRPAVIQDAMRMNNGLAHRKQPLDKVPRIRDDIDIQPQHPICIAQRPEQ